MFTINVFLGIQRHVLEICRNSVTCYPNIIIKNIQSFISFLKNVLDCFSYFFKSLIVVPPLMPSICVCMLPPAGMWQVSELDELILGVIALGGGDLTVVVLSIVEVLVEFVLLFVSIQLLFVALSQPSSANAPSVVRNTKHKASNIRVIIFYSNYRNPYQVSSDSLM